MAAADELLTIGQLAEQAGVTVKTVRFYSDRGLLPEAGRSGGGHRRYAPEALDRLRRVRALRALGVPVVEVGRALEREDALEDALAARLRDLDGRLVALRWQEAAVRLVRESGPAERAERLRLVGALPSPPSTDVLARFWRRVLPPRLSARLLDAMLQEAVPPLPPDPEPRQVLALARLHALVSGRQVPSVARLMPAPSGAKCRPDVLYEGLREAFGLAAAPVRERREPHAGEALDCFVGAFSRAHGVRDTPAYRRLLDGMLTRGDDPVIARCWQLTAELFAPEAGPPAATLGASDAWLRAALTRQLAAAGH